MQLHQWLAEKNPSYDDGLRLLQEFGFSEVKIDTIKRLKGTRLAITKMQSWLEPLSKNKPAVRQHYHSTNETVKALDDTWRRNYKTANQLFQTIIKNSISTEQQKGEAALKILDIFQNDIEPIWKDLKHFDEHGTLPEVHSLTPAKEMSLVDKIKRQNTLRTYLSKYKDNPDKAAKCDQWKQELSMIETEIKESNK